MTELCSKTVKMTELCFTSTCNVYVFVPSVSQKQKASFSQKQKAFQQNFEFSLKPSISQNQKASQLNFKFFHKHFYAVRF
jgi:hypothetical protein